MRGQALVKRQGRLSVGGTGKIFAPFPAREKTVGSSMFYCMLKLKLKMNLSCRVYVHMQEMYPLPIKILK